MTLPQALKEWMDDLSEDWISQPPSSSHSSPSQLHNSTFKQKSVLSERSQNASNIQASSVQRRDRQNGLSRRSLSDASSSGSQTGRCCGTTARKSVSASPPKSRRQNEELEWKKRLLHGGMGFGQQKDLFSPMALESLFQKPGSKGSVRKAQSDNNKPKGLSFLKSLDSISSSPPPWPSSSRPSTKILSRRGMPSTRQNLEALDEEDDELKLDGSDGSQIEKLPEKTELSNSETTTHGDQQQHGSRARTVHSINHNEDLVSRKTSFGSARLQPACEKNSRATSCNFSQNSDDFSPVFISKHNTADGRIAYAALDLSKSELEAQLKRLRAPKATPSRAISQTVRNTTTIGDDSSLARIESEALPEDLPVGTPDVVDLPSIGEFVSIKRGGYSDIGSFKRRPLSPSPLARPISRSVDDSSMLLQSEIQALDLESTSVLPTAPTPPNATAPKTPCAERKQNEFLSPQRTKSSNSPLKLFENHDTFTANRLQRRISQLEEPDNLRDMHKAAGSPSRRLTEEDLSVVEEASFIHEKGKECRKTSIQRHFGQGDLDGHTFDGDQLSLECSRIDNKDELPSRSPSPDMLPPGYQQPFRFHVEEPPSDFADTFKGKRRPSKTSTNGGLSVAKRSDRNRPRLSVHTADARVTSQPSQISQVSEGKRPLTPSPFKSPTPKRRRTVVRKEFTAGVEVDETRVTLTHDSHSSFQHALSRKRRDARHGTERTLADPDILAQRSILRPRNPTPSQRRRTESEQAIDPHPAAAAAAAETSSSRLRDMKKNLSIPPPPSRESGDDMQVRALATHLAVISENVAQRKKSVTTQDFLDDAMKVMHFIRTQYRPNGSNLVSINEGESEKQKTSNEMESEFESQLRSKSFDDLSLERPPSREGRPHSAWRTGRSAKYDARVVSHLRKFQEDDNEAFLTASSRSSGYHLANGNEATQAHIETVTSDPPGLRIIGQSKLVQERNRSGSDSSLSKAANSNGTNETNGSRASHSSRTSINSTMARTTNSRKSENVATLPPEAVAHLIPDEVAGMTYDKELRRWVKAKSPKKPTEHHIANEHSGMTGVTGSDNDPFGDIPDLTVDSAEETKHLLLSKSTGRKPIGHPPEGHSALMDFSSRPSTRGQEEVTQLAKSPEVSALHLGSCRNSEPRLQVTVTPATERRKSPCTNPENRILDEKEPTEEEVEHEISIFEGRAQPTPHSRQIRKITISMSSPAWTRAKHELSPLLESSGVSVRDYGKKSSQILPAFHDQNNRQTSVPMGNSGAVINTNDQEQDLACLPSSSPCKGADVTFYLSELPEFTLNQIDEREVQGRTLSRNNTVGPVFRGTEDRYASGNHLLVRALQDTEPDEPYWEDLRKLDIHGKNLTSLHLLDVFCDRLETLDASYNTLAQLNGAPHTIRCLSLQHNSLTSLTAWGHLFNLQYLDVSYNHIESLQGLSTLVHLRELRADRCSIRSLEGIEDLDGLLMMSLRGNKLEAVDFEGWQLSRLESLDLGENNLASVKGLHYLSSLEQLRLDLNYLQHFPQNDRPCPQLQTLDLSRNKIACLELTTFCPALRWLSVDGNEISSTAGISLLRNLETLSMRSQALQGVDCDLAPLLEARLSDLQALYLSENHISALSLPQGWYSLRILELASCGLQALPEDFGLCVPNLRALNLNFNAIKDLRPLLNIKLLHELHVAGNRLARLRKTTVVLAKLRELEVLDLRDNPFSIGFHTKAVQTGTVSSLSGPVDHTESHMTRKVEKDSQMQFLLPPCNGDTDAQYFSRLDDGTKLRRRVYEMLLANNCRQLTSLDGLTFRREQVLVRDEIWDRLVLLGVLKRSGKVIDDGDERVVTF
ncbi:uncharacterized protein PV09_07331 [Verruconis gallopava]|uniref:Uncharacterized protein n=1 Tax=Verruconis gallopava TaxID=253628 RepID=A0A0D1XGF9_9PEZI|nr:uncharacterized protein PV09_07331 [Verruconis gallopava]KIW01291.1 hypothetical protein PV09_07331 [Verruconis gallopava]